MSSLKTPKPFSHFTATVLNMVTQILITIVRMFMLINLSDKKWLVDSLDSFAHVQAHFNTVLSMHRQRHWQPRHTVVAVAQDFDSHAFIFLKTLGESHPKIVLRNQANKKGTNDAYNHDTFSTVSFCVKLCFPFKSYFFFYILPDAHFSL